MPQPHWDRFSRTCERTIYGAGVKTYFLSSGQPFPSSAPLEIYAEIGWSPMLLYHRGSYTPLSMGLANYKYFQIIIAI